MQLTWNQEVFLYVLAPLILAPKVATPIMNVATKLDYGVSGGLDDQANLFLQFEAGKGPIKTNLKFSVDMNGNIKPPLLGAGLSVSPNVNFQAYHDGSIEYNNITINDYSYIYGD